MKSSLRKFIFNFHVRAPLCLLTCAFGGAAGWAQAPTSGSSTTYNVTNICTPGGFPVAADINDKGQVVGVATAADNSAHPFLWQHGETTELPAGLIPVRINNSGQVLANNATHAFIWQNGNLTGLGAFSGADMNDKGQVVGQQGQAGAVLWQNGILTDISQLGSPDPLAAATGINERGDIAALVYNYATGGQDNGVLVKDGKDANLGVPDGSSGTLPGRVNAKGQVIGYLEGGNFAFRHAFVWQAGTMTDLGTLAGAAKGSCPTLAYVDCISEALAINNAGLVVGFSTDPLANSNNAAILWRDGRLIKLNKVIPATSGWGLAEAHGINSQGQIVGAGSNSAHPGCTFLLTPTPTLDATLQLSLPSWQFAAHPIGETSGPGIIWIYNSGPQAATFSSVQFSGADPKDFAVAQNTCGSTLAPFTTCKVAFHFTPTAVGERTASLTLTGDAIGSPQIIPVQGFGSGR